LAAIARAQLDPSPWEITPAHRITDRVEEIDSVQL
jgi:hypothetical protein